MDMTTFTSNIGSEYWQGSDSDTDSANLSDDFSNLLYKGEEDAPTSADLGRRGSMEDSKTNEGPFAQSRLPLNPGLHAHKFAPEAHTVSPAGMSDPMSIAQRKSEEGGEEAESKLSHRFSADIGNDYTREDFLVDTLLAAQTATSKVLGRPMNGSGSSSPVSVESSGDESQFYDSPFSKEARGVANSVSLLGPHDLDVEERSAAPTRGRGLTPRRSSGRNKMHTTKSSDSFDGSRTAAPTTSRRQQQAAAKRLSKPKPRKTRADPSGGASQDPRIVQTRRTTQPKGAARSAAPASPISGGVQIGSPQQPAARPQIQRRMVGEVGDATRSPSPVATRGRRMSTGACSNATSDSVQAQVLARLRVRAARASMTEDDRSRSRSRSPANNSSYLNRVRSEKGVDHIMDLPKPQRAYQGRGATNSPSSERIRDALRAISPSLRSKVLDQAVDSDTDGTLSEDDAKDLTQPILGAAASVRSHPAQQTSGLPKEWRVGVSESRPLPVQLPSSAGLRHLSGSDEEAQDPPAVNETYAQHAARVRQRAVLSHGLGESSDSESDHSDANNDSQHVVQPTPARRLVAAQPTTEMTSSCESDSGSEPEVIPEDGAAPMAMPETPQLSVADRVRAILGSPSSPQMYNAVAQAEPKLEEEATEPAEAKPQPEVQEVEVQAETEAVVEADVDQGALEAERIADAIQQAVGASDDATDDKPEEQEAAKVEEETATETEAEEQEAAAKAKAEEEEAPVEAEAEELAPAPVVDSDAVVQAALDAEKMAASRLEAEAKAAREAEAEAKSAAAAAKAETDAAIQQATRMGSELSVLDVVAAAETAANAVSEDLQASEMSPIGGDMASELNSLSDLYSSDDDDANNDWSQLYVKSSPMAAEPSTPTHNAPEVELSTASAPAPATLTESEPSVQQRTSAMQRVVKHGVDDARASLNAQKEPVRLSYSDSSESGPAMRHSAPATSKPETNRVVAQSAIRAVPKPGMVTPVRMKLTVEHESDDGSTSDSSADTAELAAQLEAAPHKFMVPLKEGVDMWGRPAEIPTELTSQDANGHVRFMVHSYAMTKSYSSPNMKRKQLVKSGTHAVAHIANVDGVSMKVYDIAPTGERAARMAKLAEQEAERVAREQEEEARKAREAADNTAPWTSVAALPVAAGATSEAESDNSLDIDDIAALEQVASAEPGEADDAEDDARSVKSKRSRRSGRSSRSKSKGKKSHRRSRAGSASTAGEEGESKGLQRVRSVRLAIPEDHNDSDNSIEADEHVDDDEDATTVGSRRSRKHRSKKGKKGKKGSKKGKKSSRRSKKGGDGESAADDASDGTSVATGVTGETEATASESSDDDYDMSEMSNFEKMLDDDDHGETLEKSAKKRRGGKKKSSRRSKPSRKASANSLVSSVGQTGSSGSGSSGLDNEEFQAIFNSDDEADQSAMAAASAAANRRMANKKKRENQRDFVRLTWRLDAFVDKIEELKSVFAKALESTAGAGAHRLLMQADAAAAKAESVKLVIFESTHDDHIRGPYAWEMQANEDPTDSEDEVMSADLRNINWKKVPVARDEVLRMYKEQIIKAEKVVLDKVATAKHELRKATLQGSAVELAELLSSMRCDHEHARDTYESVNVPTERLASMVNAAETCLSQAAATVDSIELVVSERRKANKLFKRKSSSTKTAKKIAVFIEKCAIKEAKLTHTLKDQVAGCQAAVETETIEIQKYASEVGARMAELQAARRASTVALHRARESVKDRAEQIKQLTMDYITAMTEKHGEDAEIEPLPALEDARRLQMQVAQAIQDAHQASSIQLSMDDQSNPVLLQRTLEAIRSSTSKLTTRVDKLTILCGQLRMTANSVGSGMEKRMAHQAGVATRRLEAARQQLKELQARIASSNEQLKFSEVESDQLKQRVEIAQAQLRHALALHRRVRLAQLADALKVGSNQVISDLQALILDSAIAQKAVEAVHAELERVCARRDNSKWAQVRALVRVASRLRAQGVQSNKLDSASKAASKAVTAAQQKVSRETLASLGLCVSVLKGTAIPALTDPDIWMRRSVDYNRQSLNIRALLFPEEEEVAGVIANGSLTAQLATRNSQGLDLRALNNDYSKLISRLKATSACYIDLISQMKAANMSTLPADLGMPLKQALLRATESIKQADKHLPTPDKRLEMQLTLRKQAAFEAVVREASIHVYLCEYNFALVGKRWKARQREKAEAVLAKRAAQAGAGTPALRCATNYGSIGGEHSVASAEEAAHHISSIQRTATTPTLSDGPATLSPQSGGAPHGLPTLDTTAQGTGSPYVHTQYGAYPASPRAAVQQGFGRASSPLPAVREKHRSRSSTPSGLPMTAEAEAIEELKRELRQLREEQAQKESSRRRGDDVDRRVALEVERERRIARDREETLRRRLEEKEKMVQHQVRRRIQLQLERDEQELRSSSPRSRMDDDYLYGRRRDRSFEEDSFSLRSASRDPYRDEYALRSPSRHSSRRPGSATGRSRRTSVDSDRKSRRSRRQQRRYRSSTPTDESEYSSDDYSDSDEDRHRRRRGKKGRDRRSKSRKSRRGKSRKSRRHESDSSTSEESDSEASDMTESSGEAVQVDISNSHTVDQGLWGAGGPPPQHPGGMHHTSSMHQSFMNLGSIAMTEANMRRSLHRMPSHGTLGGGIAHARSPSAQSMRGRSAEPGHHGRAMSVSVMSNGDLRQLKMTPRRDTTPPPILRPGKIRS